MQRPCTECPELLPEGSKAKTCSTACRQKRARRTKREAKERGNAAAARTRIPAEHRVALEDVAHEVMKEELVPIIRESITEDALGALKAMVGLLPATVEQLAMDIEDRDDLVRQKAHAMVLKYTVGHDKVMPAEDPRRGLTIINAMPRPDSLPLEASDTEAPLVDATEMRVCDVCQEEKASPEFVGESLRCRSCMAGLQSKVARFMDGNGG